MKQSIERIWFSDENICILTSENEQRSLPLEVFPALFYATEEERQDYYLWDDNRSIRWEKIDEDIHISNFYDEETVDYDNEVNHLLSKFPYLDCRAFAERIGMHWTLLERLRFGVVKASASTVQRIREGIRAIGKEMSAAVL